MLEGQPVIVAEPPESFTATRHGIDIKDLPAAKQLLIEAIINDMTDDDAFDLAADWRVKFRAAKGGQGSSSPT